MFKIFLLFFSLLFLSVYARAETIHLKSGKIISADILEQNSDYIKIDFQGNPLYYEKKYVARIDNFSEGQKEEKGMEGEPSESVAAGHCLEKGLESALSGDLVKARKELHGGLLTDGGDNNITAVLELFDALDSGKITREYALDLFSGLLSMLRNDYERAIPCFKRVLGKDPANIDVLYNLGVCYYSMDKFTPAIASLKKILDINPDEPDVYGLLGSAYYLSGDMRQAKENFVLARELFRKCSDTESSEGIGVLLTQLFDEQASGRN
ncbi:MAG: tetratricopeptide repeat protein [Candidatus Omnitrophica bacterium]|nr:tetratricopeptide repeat protein [Candidatus Omnitrophota bacterium]